MDRFSRHFSTFSARLPTIAVVNNMPLALLFVVLAFPASVQQRKALKMQPRCAQQPDCAYHTYQMLQEFDCSETLSILWKGNIFQGSTVVYLKIKNKSSPAIDKRVKLPLNHTAIVSKSTAWKCFMYLGS